MNRQHLVHIRPFGETVVKTVCRIWLPFGTAMTLCLGMIACAATSSHGIRNGADIQKQIFSETDLQQTISVLELQGDAHARYLQALLYDETGHPEKALSAYTDVLRAARVDDRLYYEALASAIAVVAIRDRISHFESKVTPMIRELSNKPGMLPDEAVFQLRTLRFSFALKKGVSDASAELLRLTGCLPHWLLAGPFDAADPSLYARFVFKNAPWPKYATLGPGRPAVPVASRTLDVCQVTSPAYWTSPEGVLVGKTTLVHPESGEVRFRLQGAFSIEVYANGTKIYEQNDETRWTSNVTWFSVSLPKGTYVLHVVAASDEVTPSFSLSAINAFTRTAVVKSSVPTTEAIPVIQVPPAIRHIPPAPQTVSAKIAAFKYHLWNDDPYTAASLMSKFPKNHSIAAILRAQWMAASPFTAPEVGYEKARRIYSETAKSNGLFYSAPLFLAQYEFSNERLQQSLDILHAAVVAFPEEPRIRLALAEILYSHEWYSEALRAVEDAEALLGVSCEVLQWKYNIAAARHEYGNAFESAKEISQCSATSSLYATELTRQGRFADAAKQMKKVVAQQQNSPAVMLEYADALFRSMQWEKGIRYLQQARIRFPFEPQIIYALNDALQAVGRTEDARALWGETLTMPPSLQLDRLRQSLLLDDTLSKYRVDGLKVVQRYLQSAHDDEPDFLWILDRMVHIVDRYGNRTELTHWIGRVNTVDMVDRHGELEVPYGSVLLSARTIKQDGTPIYPGVIENKPTLSMQNLEPGDFIEFESVSYFQTSDIFIGGFDTGPFYFEDFHSAFVRSEVILVTPEDMQVQYDTRGIPPQKTEVVHDGIRAVTFRKRDGKPLIEEPDTPVTTEYLSSVRMTSNATLSNLCGYLNRRVVSKGRKDPYLQAFVENIKTASADESTPLEVALYNWVIENITDDALLSDSPSHIFSRRRGSRVRLYQALLQTAGIHSQLGFVTPTFEDRTPTDIPDINRIPFPVLQIDDGRFISLMDDHAPFGFIPSVLRNQPVLWPTTCTESVVAKGIWPSIEETVKAKITLDEQGNAVGRIHHRISGEQAVSLRQVFEGNPDSRKQLFEEVILNEMLPSAILESLQILHLDEIDAPLEFEYAVQLPGLGGQWESNKLEIPFTTHFTQYTGGLHRREFPLVLSAYQHRLVEISLEIPSSMEFDAIAVNRCEQMENSMAKYCIRTVPDKNNLSITIETRLDVNRISPAQFTSLHRFTLITEQMNAQSIGFH